MKSRGQCLRWRKKARLKFKKLEEDIKEKKKKLLEKAAQIKSTAVEAKPVAASCIYMQWLDSYAAWQTRFCKTANNYV